MADTSNPRGNNSLAARTRRALAKVASVVFSISSDLLIQNNKNPKATTVSIVQKNQSSAGGVAKLNFINDTQTAGIFLANSLFAGSYPNQLQMVGNSGIVLSSTNKPVLIDGGGGGTSQLMQFGGNPLVFDASMYYGSVGTTNAVSTALVTIPIAAGTTYLIEARVVARRTGGSSGTADDGGSWIAHATYTTKLGVVTLMGTVQLLGVTDVGGYLATLVISGSNVNVQVTGVANTNVDWNCTVMVNDVS